MNDISINAPRISASLEDRSDKNKSMMIKIEGTILNQLVFVLIDPRASLSYIGPWVVEKCKRKTEKYKTTWLVQLATSTKQRVTS